jgi:hypothetical protein
MISIRSKYSWQEGGIVSRPRSQQNKDFVDLDGGETMKYP